MKHTLSKKHKGHRSHVHGKAFAQGKKARLFYERDEKYLRKKYIKRSEP